MSAFIYVFQGLGMAPKRAYLDLESLLAEVRAQYPGATVTLEEGREKDLHGGRVLVQNHLQHGPMGMWTGHYRLGFTRIPLADPQHWERLRPDPGTSSEMEKRS